MNKCLKNNTFALLVLSQKTYFNPPNLCFVCSKSVHTPYELYKRWSYLNTNKFNSYSTVSTNRQPASSSGCSLKPVKTRFILKTVKKCSFFDNLARDHITVHTFVDWKISFYRSCVDFIMCFRTILPCFV